jgi:hypothetical protein
VHRGEVEYSRWRGVKDQFNCYTRNPAKAIFDSDLFFDPELHSLTGLGMSRSLRCYPLSIFWSLARADSVFSSTFRVVQTLLVRPSTFCAEATIIWETFSAALSASSVVCQSVVLIWLSLSQMYRSWVSSLLSIDTPFMYISYFPGLPSVELYICHHHSMVLRTFNCNWEDSCMILFSHHPVRSQKIDLCPWALFS